MNPRTADLTINDPTVAKCQRFPLAWGYGGIYVGNAFADRATDQKQPIAVLDPVGPYNDRDLITMAKAAAIVVFAHGEPHKRLRYRGPDVARLLMNKACVKPHALRLRRLERPVIHCICPKPSSPLYGSCSTFRFTQGTGFATGRENPLHTERYISTRWSPPSFLH
jgi:hypothetical protein